jgi:hypothetical protein
MPVSRTGWLTAVPPARRDDKRDPLPLRHFGELSREILENGAQRYRKMHVAARAFTQLQSLYELAQHAG